MYRHFNNNCIIRPLEKNDNNIKNEKYKEVINSNLKHYNSDAVLG